ncbi:SHOCT domain-containing protein [Carnobacterium funditum]|uniref:SHOCT domain-containing protein n=1 Tax=Carnobacterium funditum TaxID=2752 RepID=UPI000556E987|nr:amino acid acetyltransferase [Carnobacterium funditum]
MYDCLNLFNRGGISSMMFMGIFWIILLVVVLFLTGKFFSHKQNPSSDKETPLDVLQKEYAKGNISESEYLERKTHL